MKALYEILVPTVVPNSDGKKFFTTRFHKTWDAKVRALSNGLTILTPAKGQWVSETGVLFEERMIPVRIFCFTDDIQKIADLTLKMYSQEAVMYYKISTEVEIVYSKTVKNSS